ncbi:MAG: ornithine cyclodeaminase [Pseudomonadota bacterium]
MRHITAADLSGPIDWSRYLAAIEDGHRRPPAKIEDVFLGEDGRTLLSRAAWVEGIGFGVKTVTAMTANAARGIPTVHGAMMLLDEHTGQVRALVDSDVLTNIKTVSDSVLGARFLARPESQVLLIVGAGSVASQLAVAYPAIFPDLKEVLIWNRTHERAVALAGTLAATGLSVTAASSLRAALSRADIVSAATMSASPVLEGDMVQAGTHVDLIGAFRKDMREADDALIRKSKVFVDSRNSTFEHIGELRIPLTQGTISKADVLGDLYDIVAGRIPSRKDRDITLFKNGGGAHLDLMVADAILHGLA